MLKTIGKYIFFMGSIGLFIGATFVLYHEYNSYNERVKRYTTTAPQSIKNINSFRFTNDDVDALESFRVQRNILLGYESFLKESAINYQPENFSYPNLLKDKFITQLDNIKSTQPYWNTIFLSFYTDISSNEDIPLEGYDAIMRIPTTYVNNDIEGVQDMKTIEKISTSEYWKRKVFELDRTSENIENTWKQNKAFFYTFMSNSKYDKLCKPVITDLVEIYERMTQESNYMEFYNNYDVRDSIFLTFPSAEYVKMFKYSWPFSFWDRRIGEENDKTIYKILKEIKNHYDN